MANDDTVSLDGMGFIMELQAASHAHTTSIIDSLHANALRDVIELCDFIERLDEILDSATVIDRLTERRIAQHGYVFGSAASKRESAQRMLEIVTGVNDPEVARA